MEECCATCRNRYNLVKFDYSNGGCTHTGMEGFACGAFLRENQISWMVGLREDTDLCECYMPRRADND